MNVGEYELALDDMDRVIKVGGDFLTAAGVSGQQDIAAHIPPGTLNMILFFRSLHRILQFSGIHYRLPLS